MRHLILTTAVLLTLIAFLQNETRGQNNWKIEFRPSIDFALSDIADADLNTGLGFEGAVFYKFMPHLAAYAGWSWNHFSTAQSFAGHDASFEETGYAFGFQFIHPVAETGLNLLIKLGGTFNHIEIENNGGEIIIDSGHGLGWQVEAGLEITLSDRFSLLPTVRYRSKNREIQFNNATTSVDLNYISFGTGLSWSF